MWAILIETPNGTAKIIAKKFTGTAQVISIEEIFWADCENMDKDTHFGSPRLVVPYQRIYSITLLPEKKDEVKA